MIIIKEIKYKYYGLTIVENLLTINNRTCQSIVIFVQHNNYYEKRIGGLGILFVM